MNIDNINDKFSRLCSRISTELQSWDECAAEISAFGAPSECMDLATNSVRNSVGRVLDHAGYTVDSFINELTTRTSYHWAHNSGLLYVELLMEPPRRVYHSNSYRNSYRAY
jgi:hypothetical protein